MKHCIGGFRHVLLLQDTYEVLPAHILLSSMLLFPVLLWTQIRVLSSSNFWAPATALHLGRHAHPGNGSAGKSNHTTTSPETCADCLQIVLGLTESMGEAGRCAAHKAPASQVPVATHTGRCAAHKAPASQAPVATKAGKRC